jgi:hypothetical protein
MLKKLRLLFKRNTLVRKFVAYYLAPSGIFDRIIMSYKISEEWQIRIKEVIECPDFEKIKKVPNAGQIVKGKQIMHNGLKINLGSYYGPEYSNLLAVTKGIHEPQEEYVFQEILKKIPENGVMVELGSFWSFYSMWFNSNVKNAVNIMVEPDEFNLGFGVRNFKLNNLKGEFINAFVGSESIYEDRILKQICIDDFFKSGKLEHLNILHSDIQGYEFDMLKGSKKSLEKRKIDYIFISTHSNTIHYDCIKYLKSFDYEIMCEVDMDKTFSEDGLIVASSPEITFEQFMITSKVKSVN